MHLTEALVDFIDACADRKPTPGGGAASVLVGALGASMGEMAAAYSEKSEEKERIKACLEKMSRVREALLPLIESDCEAFERVSTAYKQSKTAPQGDETPDERIQHSLRVAAEVPLRGARLCLEGLESIGAVSDVINPRLITDSAAAALFLAGSFRGCWFNVRVNLNSIDDKEHVKRILDEGEKMISRVNELENRILTRVEAVLAE